MVTTKEMSLLLDVCESCPQVSLVFKPPRNVDAVDNSWEALVHNSLPVSLDQTVSITLLETFTNSKEQLANNLTVTILLLKPETLEAHPRRFACCVESLQFDSLGSPAGLFEASPRGGRVTAALIGLGSVRCLVDIRQLSTRLQPSKHTTHSYMCLGLWLILLSPAFFC